MTCAPQNEQNAPKYRPQIIYASVTPKTYNQTTGRPGESKQHTSGNHKSDI